MLNMYRVVLLREKCVVETATAMIRARSLADAEQKALRTPEHLDWSPSGDTSVGPDCTVLTTEEVARNVGPSRQGPISRLKRRPR